MDGFRYADPSAWEDWQREYRFGAFYVFPPPGIIEPIDALRRRYDPRSASYCQAHLSLSEPLSGPLTSPQLAELRTALAAVEPFDLTYGPLRSFPPYPGVTCTIAPADAFQRLRDTIHATSLFKDVVLARKDIAPHMTIAEFISLKSTDELLRSLSDRVPEGTFRCDAIEYAIPDREFSFQRVLVIPIGSVT